MAYKFRYIAPMVPKALTQPSDNANSDPKFRLDAVEIDMWDHFAQEPIQAAGTEGELFQRDLKGSKIDPLYSEPTTNSFIGPYKLMVHVEWPEYTPDVTEAGMRALWPSGLWVPRKNIEQVKARAPVEGDIVRFWKLPYFDQRADRNQGTKGAGFYFEIVKVNDDGHMIDNAAFVGFRCDLKRRSSFAPEQQLIKPPSGPGTSPNDPCE